MSTALSLSDAANWAQIISIPVTLFCWYFTRETASKSLRRTRPLFLAAAALLVCWVLYRRGWTGSFFRWLAHPVVVPVWLLGTGLICAVLLPLLWLAIPKLLRAADGNGGHPARHWKEYTSDSIFGVSWLWGYLANSLDDDRLVAFCPAQSCRCRLDIVEDYNRGYGSWLGNAPATATCVSCGFRREFEWPISELRRRVLLEIERRLRTGEYQTALTPPAGKEQ